VKFKRLSRYFPFTVWKYSGRDIDDSIPALDRQGGTGSPFMVGLDWSSSQVLRPSVEILRDDTVRFTRHCALQSPRV
jgi:hypothetical protein